MCYDWLARGKRPCVEFSIEFVIRHGVTFTGNTELFFLCHSLKMSQSGSFDNLDENVSLSAGMLCF